MKELNIELTKKQKRFIDSQAFETLFGGAAGGGKSRGQLIDSLLYALKYPQSKQILFRSTFSDLEKSLIRESLKFYPMDLAKYNDSKHTWKFKNGSIIDFGYIAYEKDVYQYQSAEYDVIRFDELTHFTEFMYVYMISRCRGANPYPKGIKSSTNPGGIGHNWVKERFIDIGEPNKVHKCQLTAESKTISTRIFIPSLVQDNKFLLENDPDYIDRLEQLGYSFVIYHYSKEMILESANRYAEAYRYQGKYMEYMLQIIFKMPRTEKFNIGNEFKNVMYQMLENILFINKVEMSKRLHYSNLIDAELNTQRIMIRLMYKNKWIDEKKYRVSIEMLYEIGKIVGGLVKCYAKNNSKSVR